MAKWSGKIGFAEHVEVSPGVWKDQITEHVYCGDLCRNTYRPRSADKINDDIAINNEIRILLNPYVNENLHKMRYAEFMGIKWKITNIEVQYPRLILSLGGEYNG